MSETAEQLSKEPSNQRFEPRLDVSLPVYGHYVQRLQ